MFSHFIHTVKNIKKDFDRYTNGSNNLFLIIAKMLHNPGMIFSVFYRLERFLLYESNLLFRILGIIFYPLYFFITYYILMYHIEPRVEIEGGLFLHNMNIVITDRTKIGKNASIMGQTTIGTDFETGGKIEIGNNVKIGTGAKIIAKEPLIISNNTTIGANAVVTKSIHEKNAVYVGIPAKMLRKK